MLSCRLRSKSDCFQVIQKLFEFGTTVQVHQLASLMETHLLPLSLQIYSCRVVQKVSASSITTPSLQLIESKALDHISADQQSTFVGELESQVLKCVQDANANHVGLLSIRHLLILI